MNWTQALEAASAKARKRGVWFYVFCDGEGGYEIGNDYDADTFFLGQEPIAALGPDGEIDR